MGKQTRNNTTKKFILLAKFYNISMDYFTGLSPIQNKNQIKELDKIIIGKNIKKICRDNNLTQIKLAKQLITTQSAISAILNGKVLILTKYLYQIVKKYNYSINDLCQ